MLTIEKVDLIREDYSIYIQNGNNPEKLGNIDKESVKEGIVQGWLAEKPGNGQQLKLKVQTITTRENAYAIAETTEGNLLRINITNPRYKKQDLNDQGFRETLVRAFDKKHVYIAKIGDQSLGIIGQHAERLEAELNKGNGQIQWQRKESSTVQKLIDTGIIRSNQQRTSIPVQITSNESTCKITINPETVQYSDRWIKRSQLVSNEQPVRNEQQEKSNQILAKINERPTIMFQDKEQKLVGIVGLAVDEKLAERTKKYLEKVGVSYEQLPASQARLEAKKGMTVFMLDESTISDELKQTFIDRAGGNIKSADTLLQPTPIIPEQTVYFYNPAYIDEEGSQQIKDAVGFVVPAQDAIAVHDWLESKDTENSYIIENDSNTAIFILENNQVGSELQEGLKTLLGEPIDISNGSGFERYESLSQELSERVYQQGSLLSQNQSPELSEYKQALQSLPNRLKKLNQEEAPLGITPAKPVQEENATGTPPALAKLSIGIAGEVPTGQTELQVSILSQKPVATEITQDYRYNPQTNPYFNLPPSTPSATTAEGLDNSPQREAVIAYTPEYSWVSEDYGYSPAIALVVDFREITKARDFLHENGFDFDETLDNTEGFNKGYYEFNLKAKDVSDEQLQLIKKTFKIKTELDNSSKKGSQQEEFTDWLEQQPEFSEEIIKELESYSSNLYLQHSKLWSEYNQTNVERYIDLNEPPSARFVEFIESIPNLNQEELNTEAQKLTNLELAWIKAATEVENEVPSPTTSSEWSKFVQDTLVNNYPQLASAIESFPSKAVEEVKPILKLEREANTELNGNKLEEALKLKQKAIEKYGEKSFELITQKAEKAFENTQSQEAATSNVAIISFKGINSDNKDAAAGVEITTPDGKKIQISESIGTATGPQAEYKAAILGLKKAQEMGITNIKLEGDSSTVIYQLQDRYQVKSSDLKPLHQEAKTLLSQFQKQEVSFVSNNGKSSSAKKIAETKLNENKLAATRKQVDIVLQNSIATLNEGQKNALSKMVAFSQQPISGNSKDNEFLLTGYAGTGKTYVIQQLLKILKQGEQQTKICFTAATNSAVKVLREMGESQGIEADTKTTHSLLGLKEKYNEVTGEVFYDRDKKERNNQHLKYDIIVVDESSMINKALREKLEEVAKQGVKVIYMGDDAQLPPVGEPASAVFQIENRADLTEVMRYGGDIGKTAETIRNNIDSTKPEAIRTSEDGTIVALSKDDFKEKIVELFNSKEFKEDNSSVKVIAYTNSRVDQINAFVKEQIFGKNSPEYVPGMRIMARSPVIEDNRENLKTLLHSSEEMTIIKAEKIRENNYNVWVLSGVNEDNKEIEFKAVAQESKLLFAEDVDKLFKIEHSKPLGEREYAVPATYKQQYGDIRLAYAITVHNSQGKTIRKGLVDESNINYRRQLALKEQDPKERERGIREHNQLRYVAMTRFKEQIFVLGDERTQQTELSTPAIALVESNESITLPSARAADPTKAIEILGKVSPDKVEALRSHLETHFKPLLENDKSNYSPGRQVAWVGAKWDLKEKDFKPGVQDDALIALVKQVYPDADIVLVTYSEQPGSGINYHGDDSYAATEARSINIGNSEWGYRAAKEQMAWTKGENPNAQYQEFKLESGIVTRFNCKNEHAAFNTEAGRWSINIWSVKNDLGKDNSVREKFENFLASKQSPRAVVNSNDDLTIKSDEWTPGGEIKVKRSYNSLKEATRNTPTPKQNQLTVKEIITIGNQTTGRAQNPQIPENPSIFGKPVPMVYSLLLHGEPPKLPVNTTIDAMRGHFRVHTTRGVDYQKVYGIKEGDIAVALGKNGEQVAFRVGKQYEITPQMIQNPAYQQAWANWEKHSVKELTQTQAQKRRIYGLFMEPLGDYVNGKIVPFPNQCVAQDSAVDGFPNLGNWNASKGGATLALRVWAGDTCKGVGVPPTVQTGAPVQKQPAASVNISPDSKDGLLAALANATALAKEEGKLQNDYQVSVNNNPEAAAGRYGVETHLQKPEGVAYASAEHAFNHQKQLNPSTDEYKLMVEVLQAKLEQHPRLCSAIAERGGTEWLENCTNITNTQDKQWEGKGKDSAFIRALTEVYTNVVEKSQQATVSVAPTNIETKTEVKTQPVKVISGGQAGADMGGLRGAKALGLITGGTAAAGWMTENGANPNLQEYGLVEGEKGSTATETYNKRTVENIRNSDGTAIFGDVNSPGSRFTVQAAQNMGKPVLHVPIDTSLNNRPTAAQQLREFVEQNNIQTLNIAGNRESKAPGLQAAVAEIVQIGLAYQQNKENTRNSPATLDTAEQEKPVVTSEIISPKVQTEKQVAPGINFNSRCPDSLGAVLTSTTVKSKQVGTIQGEYIVSFRDNQAMPAGSYGPETYTQSKPEGQPFLSAEQAFYAYKETLLLGEPRVQLMAEILTARFEQHPRLVEAVTERGGVEWLQQCTYYVSNSKDNFWEGKGEQSPYIRALKMAYINVLEKSLLKEKSPPSPSPVKPPQQTQQPDIEQALASPSHPRTQPVGAMDGIIERMRANTVQNLQDWYIAAQKLNKSENYLSRIQEVTDLYIKENISLEKTFKAMERDIKELEKINEMTSLAQRVVKTIGQEDINGIMSVQTEKYKIATKAQNQTYLVKDKDDNVLLYIKEGTIQVNNINDESLQDFQFMKLRIENTLKDIKKDLVER
ncbi:YpsA SLOG family protein [Scytonema sp. PCC 10023]|uniref:YpsA SLOG family protein n=1 Tax=Scytonema sp. PCC 10023 TaxID=1680591 RepID=UPI0039C6675D